MDEFKIEGKFKEDFYKWLSSIKNYGDLVTAFKHHYHQLARIELILKFINNIDFNVPYLYNKDHFISSVDTINNMIEKYNLEH